MSATNRWLFGELSPDGSPPAPVLPHAARLQGEHDWLDQRLLSAARLRHPTVAWWWGKRRTEDGPGAWCYLCDQLIVSFALRWPMPKQAVAAVASHRLFHRDSAGQGGGS